MKKRIMLFSSFVLLIVNFSFGFNPHHLSVLISDQKEPWKFKWAIWREQNPRVKPDFSSADIKNCLFRGNFSNVNLRYAKLTSCNLIQADFSNSDASFAILKKISIIILSGSKLNSKFNGTNFFKVQILDTKSDCAEFIKANFNESVINNSKIDYGKFRQVSFINAKINNSTLGDDFYLVDFSNSIISKSTFRCDITKKMDNISFNNAKILDCIFDCSINLATFINSELFGSNLSYLQLTNVNFTNANLTNVNFRKAKFQNVIFKNADMTGAKLERKWYDYVKKQGVRNFDKIQWM